MGSQPRGAGCPMIHATDKLHTLLAQDERVIEVLAAVSPAFEKLRDASLRGTMARLVTVEQGLAVHIFPDGIGRRVEAKRELVAIGPEPGQHERVAAQICRDIDSPVDELPVLVEEGVGSFVEPHQRDRNRVVTGRKDDREITLGEREFVNGHGDSVKGRNAFESLDLPDLVIAVLVAIKRLKAIVK